MISVGAMVTGSFWHLSTDCCVADAGARRADHVRERLLADFGDDRVLLPLLAEVRQQEQSTRQSLLAGIRTGVAMAFTAKDAAASQRDTV
jgi:hypothetical protein